jgi:hypothetical protein
MEHYHALASPMPMHGLAGPAGELSYDQMLALDERIPRKGVRGSALDGCSITQTLEPTDADRLNTRGRCVICLDDFESGQRVRRLPCLCTFHVACIDRHLHDNTTCPICRTDVLA